ncbi:hypothetical protein [Xanthomonas phage DES1]|nr:hypothetical protein [Xanthomonas phage DES1]
MCIALVKPAGVEISDETLRTCWDSNSHGAGFAYIKKGKVQIVKGLMKFADFLAAYKKLAATYKASPFLIHFRIRSAGDHNEDNTHPFQLNAGALIHNGTIHGTGASYQKGPSDTAIFVEKFKDHLNYETVVKVKDKLGKAIDYNKLAMLFDNGNYVIINEEKGMWDGGTWFSNGGFRSRFPSPRGQST